MMMMMNGNNHSSSNHHNRKQQVSPLETHNHDAVTPLSFDDDQHRHHMNGSTSSSHHERQQIRNQRRMQRRQEHVRRKEQLLRSGILPDNNNRYSMIWMILTMGIILSLLDVIYIMKHLEVSFPLSTNTQISFSLTVKKQDDKDNTKKGDNSIKSMNDLYSPTMSNITKLIQDKGPILTLIREAGISFDPIDDADLIRELPNWSDVIQMYGSEPILYGLKEGNCQRFQTQSDPGDHLVGVAGTFNSGTNLMAELLIANCHMPERQKKYGMKQQGIRWQVPWGKHTPPGDKEYRETHKTKKDKDIEANEIMPMVTIRDPLIWLKSMCKHHYTAKWYQQDDLEHCPNFSLSSKKTTIKYADFDREHTSVLHHWNDYYQEYLHVEFPFLLVRFEDLVFHPKETTKQVCECAGGAMKPKFKYIVDSAKKGIGAHGKVRTGYVDALVKYGTEARRYSGYNSVDDLEYIHDNVDPELMKLMNYSPVDPRKAAE